MERLTIKRQDGWHVEDWKNGIDHHGPAVDRLAAYEDTGLEPEEITVKPCACVFYCNRRCNLNGDWCAEGPECTKTWHDRNSKDMADEKNTFICIMNCIQRQKRRTE